MSEVLPRFLSYSFDFADGIEAPLHLEEVPSMPNKLGMYALLGVTNEGKSYLLALDIPSFDLAAELAVARIRHMENTIELYGYSDNVDLKYPDDSCERVYVGRPISDSDLFTD